MDTRNKNLRLHTVAATFDEPYVVYIKQVQIQGQHAYAIFASNGTELAVVDDREVAFAAALQHEYLPLSVH